ncbi:MAG: 5-(carboxyamino)imidazole ribonucleotide synthase [Tepidisphaerales bacterium]
MASTPETQPILPGATVGVLGSGQLGRMFAIAARRMGYRVHTYSPDTDTPTGQVADVEVVGAYEDLDAVRQFARGVSVVTFEFENVPYATAQAAAEVAPVRPDGHVLHTTQHRLREKTFLRDHGFPVVPFERVTSEAELAAATARLGFPCVLKTAGWGYDGKGQVKLGGPGELAKAWASLNGQEAVLEAFIHFTAEASVVCARGLDGAFTHWGLIENVHRNHILDLSVAPGRLPDTLKRQAVEIAHAVAEALDVVGVLCVEFFVTARGGGRDGGLLINELAPRPHNSGHLTFDFSVTSQFEQQLRAVCGLPLGRTDLTTPAAAMAQLLGDLWTPRPPDWPKALEDGVTKLHLYGKAEPRPGRKMGHLTSPGRDAEHAVATVLAARAAATAAGAR